MMTAAPSSAPPPAPEDREEVLCDLLLSVVKRRPKAGLTVLEGSKLQSSCE